MPLTATLELSLGECPRAGRLSSGWHDVDLARTLIDGKAATGPEVAPSVSPSSRGPAHHGRATLWALWSRAPLRLGRQVRSLLRHRRSPLLLTHRCREDNLPTGRPTAMAEGPPGQTTNPGLSLLGHTALSTAAASPNGVDCQRRQRLNHLRLAASLALDTREQPVDPMRAPALPLKTAPRTQA